jgi:membrane protease YdiL (CAAX protease family)
MFAHLGNKGETPWGILQVGLAGAVFAFSLWRTGSLWWAIGFHCSWDWAQSYFYGTNDSGLASLGHLFNSHPMGNAMLSGGNTGPEGSILCTPIFLLIAVIIHFTLPRRNYPLTPDQSPLPSPSGLISEPADR